MSAPIVLIGANGSMGRRYQAILRHLGQDFRAFDMETTLDSIVWAAERSAGVILATPTPTHADWCRLLSGAPVPLLCEKPLTTDLAELDTILKRAEPLQMMAQYRYLDRADLEGLTSYDFYHSGSDGLAWDCITLLGLARGEVSLKNESPIWRATLNGRPLTLDRVGASYVTAVKDWLARPEGDRAWMRRAHHRAAAWMGNGVMTP